MGARGGNSFSARTHRKRRVACGPILKNLVMPGPQEAAFYFISLRKSAARD